MFEVVNHKHPKFLMSKRPKTLAVVGADLDLSMCKALTEGDKVLMEVNGVRSWSAQKIPLVAEMPWTVISNDPQGGDKGGPMSGHLVLRHPRIKEDFRLGYRQLLKTGRRDPAVFIETNGAIQDGTLFVILQFVAIYIPENVAADMFPTWTQE